MNDWHISTNLLLWIICCGVFVPVAMTPIFTFLEWLFDLLESKPSAPVLPAPGSRPPWAASAPPHKMDPKIEAHLYAILGRARLDEIKQRTNHR